MTVIRRSAAQRSGALALVLGVLLCGATFATPFTLKAKLTGDPRPDNPDGLVIDVTVSGDTADPTVKWTIDIDSPLHPNAKLHEFYANLKLGTNQTVSLSEFAPAGWGVDSPATTVGGGNIDFDLELLNLGSDRGTEVTNAQDLTFWMTLLVGGTKAMGFDPAILTGALESCSTDKVLGCGQLGAHLQSLSVPDGLNARQAPSDSGFVLGSWSDQGPPNGVPEPGSLALSLAAALLALAGARRSRRP